MGDKNSDRQDRIILVDENDAPVGTEEKIRAHLRGHLHRAFSIFIFNSKGDLLLQKRAKEKYHSGALWSNTCCGHPKPGDRTKDAALRRLIEEMGFSCPLTEPFSFSYKAKLENGLTENEYDHVFYGYFDGQPNPSKLEVEDWKWVPVDHLITDIRANPHDYTPWLMICVERISEFSLPG